MSILLSIGWFLFGMFVGALFLIGLAGAIGDVKRENKNGKDRE